MMRRLVLTAILWGSLLLSLSAQPKRFHIDRLHSSITFSLRYLGIIDLNGRAPDYYGTLLFDESNLETASVDVLIRAASLDTAMPNRDRDLRSDQYLDVDQFPAIRFSSHALRAAPDGYVATGPLTIRGTTRTIDLPFQIVDRYSDDTKTELAVLAGPIRISRTDFGVGTVSRTTADRILLGDAVDLTMVLRLTEERPDERTIRGQYPETTITAAEREAVVGTYKHASGGLWHIEQFGEDLAYFIPEAAVFRRLVPVGPNLFRTETIGSLMRFEETPTGFQLTYRVEQEPERHQMMRRLVTWDTFRSWIARDGVSAALDRYQHHATQAPDAILPFSETAINALGYDYLGEQQFTKATALFTFNTTLFPHSANAYDSLGEAYLIQGDTTQALTHYQQAAQLDPTNRTAERLLDALEEN